MFDRRWIESTRPTRALRAYRRYAIAAGVTLLIGALLADSWITHPQMELTERQQLEARGVAITATEERQGTRIVLPVDASQALLEEVIPLLKTVGPVMELDLSGTKVTNLAPLAALTALRKINLGPRLVSNTPASSWPATNDWTDAAPITDFIPLTRLTNLQALWLLDTQVADAAPLAQLTNLQRLDLSRTEVADAAPLAGLTNLRELSLSGTQVADAAPLARLTNLQSLDLSGTQVADAAPLDASPTCNRSTSPAPRSPTPPRSRLTNLHARSPAPQSPTPPRSRSSPICTGSTSPAPRSPTPPRSHASPTSNGSTSPAPRSPTPPSRAAHQPAKARPLRHPGRRRRPPHASPTSNGSPSGPGRRRRPARTPHQPARPLPL